MIIFIPTSDYSRDATTAASFTDIDLGSVRIGTAVAFSFRIGNTGSVPATWTLSVNDNFSHSPDKWTLPTGGTLQAGETTDTLSVHMALPINAVEMGHIAELVASDGTEETTLQIVYEAMGTNSWRRTQWPVRAGAATDNAANVIDAVGDILRVLVFDPIQYVPVSGYGVKMKAKPLGPPADKLAGYSPWKVINGADHCDRLNPLDATYGYRQSVYILQGQFSRESRQTRTVNLTADNTTMTYDVSASIVMRGEDELTRHWALFAPANEAEPEQYKRSVFILQRQGELWSIENIRTLDFGDQLSHWEGDLIALHGRAMGKPTYWNPFAITYEWQSDIPYRCFTCSLDLTADEFGEDASNSSNANASAIVYG